MSYLFCLFLSLVLGQNWLFLLARVVVETELVCVLARVRWAIRRGIFSLVAETELLSPLPRLVRGEPADQNLKKQISLYVLRGGHWYLGCLGDILVSSCIYFCSINSKGWSVKVRLSPLLCVNTVHIKLIFRAECLLFYFLTLVWSLSISNGCPEKRGELISQRLIKENWTSSTF